MIDYCQTFRMVKRLRSLRYIEEERGGRSRCYIEALPDEILENILSRLKTREAAATCVVSRRWSNLDPLPWCRNLDIDFTNNKEYELKYVRKSVASVFNKHRGEVDHLRIAFHDDNSYRGRTRLDRTFQEWFTIANGKRVKSLVFEVESSVPWKHSIHSLEPFRCFPTRVAISHSSWDRLTSVSLKSVVVDGSDLPRLLSMSPNLETLLLESIPVIEIYLRNCMPKLKRLEAVNCAGLSEIHIYSAPNLEYLKHLPMDSDRYNGLKEKPHVSQCNGDRKINISVFFAHTPKLGAIYLGGPFCRYLLLELRYHAPQLQKLQLEMDAWCESVWCGDTGCWNSVRSIPTLRNLKQLELRFSSTKGCYKGKLDTAIAIMHACPSLEKLALKYEIRKEDSADHSPEYHTGSDVDHIANVFLGEVEVVGWSGLEYEVKFIRYLIRTSPNLRHLLLDPTPPHLAEKSAWRGQYSPVEMAEHEMDSAAQVAQGLVGYLHKVQACRAVKWGNRGRFKKQFRMKHAGWIEDTVTSD